MALKAHGADLAFKGGLFNGNRYLAAFRARNQEQSWGDYARILRTLANWEASGRNYVNNGVANFNPQPTTVGAMITHWGLYDALNGGNLLLDDELDSALPAPAVGADTGFDDNAIGWGFSSKVTAAGSLLCCNAGLLSGNRYLTIHTADPGTVGDSVVAEDPIQAVAAQWTLDTSGNNRRARNNAELSFGISMSDLPRAAWVALRSGNAANSPVIWKDQLDVTPDDPELGDTLKFAVNQLVITIPIDV